MSTTRRKLVRTYIERLFCDCGGEMTKTQLVLTSWPPKHQHGCLTCGAQEFLDDSYPRNVYQEEESTA